MGSKVLFFQDTFKDFSVCEGTMGAILAGTDRVPGRIYLPTMVPRATVTLAAYAVTRRFRAALLLGTVLMPNRMQKLPTKRGNRVWGVREMCWQRRTASSWLFETQRTR